MGLNMLYKGMKTLNFELERFDYGLGTGRSLQVRGFFDLGDFELGEQLLMIFKSIGTGPRNWLELERTSI